MALITAQDTHRHVSSLSGLLLQAIITPGDTHDTSSNPVDSLELRHLYCEKHSLPHFLLSVFFLVDLSELGLRKVNNLYAVIQIF